MTGRSEVLAEKSDSQSSSWFGSISKIVSDYVYQTVSGFMQPFSNIYSNITTLLGDYNLRGAVTQTVSANLLLTGSIVLFEAFQKNLRQYIFSGEASTVEYALELLATMVFVRSAATLVLPNTLNTQSITKILNAQAKKNPQVAANEMACTCEESAKIEATLLSTMYYWGKMGMTYLVSRLPCGKYPAEFLEALVYGQCLAEYKLASTCTKHRYEKLSNQNAYVFGLGAAFKLALDGTSYILNYYAGTNSELEKYAVFNCLFPYFMAAVILDNAPFPKSDYNFDVFYPARVLCDELIKTSSARFSQLMQCFSGKGDLLKTVENIAQANSTQILEKLLLGKGIISVQDIEKIPSINLWLSLNESIIKGALVQIGSVRMIPYLNAGISVSEWLTPVLPQFIIKDRNILRIILHEDTQRVLRIAKNFMIHLALNREAHVSTEPLLTEEQKDTIHLLIKNRIEAMRPKLTKSQLQDLHIYNIKMDALHNLIILLKNLPEKHGALGAIIREWQHDYARVLNCHRDSVIQYFKQTDTAGFIQQLIAGLEKPETKYRSEAEVRDETLNSITEWIANLQAGADKIQGSRLLQAEKILSLEELDGLIGEYYKKLEFSTIINCWKEYNWHIINAHRSIGSLLKKAIMSDEETDTAEFVQSLMKSYGFAVDEIRFTTKVASQVEAVYESIAQKIRELILKDEEGYKLKINALHQLLKMMNDITEPALFGDILSRWKRTYWADINAHRDALNGLFASLVTINTDTAIFINTLSRKFNDVIMQPKNKAVLRA